MIRIREAILVEGRYDKNTLSQIVDAPILETRGFGIFQDKAHQGFGAHHVSVVLKDDKTHKEISDFKIDFNVSEEKISIIFVE